jgi:ABC-2 type transport system permease protein
VLDRVSEFLFHGGKALFLADPYPVFNLGLAPGLENAGRNPFAPPPPEQKKGDVGALMRALGLEWDKERVVWDAHNPHPKYRQFPREIVFVSGAGEDQASGFDEQDAVTRGLNEVVLIFPGGLEARQTEGLTATPLLTTRPECGWNGIRDLVEEVPFLGPQPKPPTARRYAERKDRQVLAMRCAGNLVAPVGTERMQQGARAEKPFQAIVIADADLVSDGLYQLRREGSEDFDLDNVTFVSNCIDSLAGEEDFIQLRKQRPRHRTLTRLEAIQGRLSGETREVAKQARESAEAQLAAAQKRLDEAVEAIKARTDLDHRTQDVQLAYVEDRERRKLDAEKRRIEDEEQAAVRAAETRAERELRAEKARIRLAASALPPLPALLLGLLVYWRKSSLEAAGTSPARRRTA